MELLGSRFSFEILVSLVAFRGIAKFFKRAAISVRRLRFNSVLDRILLFRRISECRVGNKAEKMIADFD